MSEVAAARSVAVVGDVLIDWHIARLRHGRAPATWTGAERAELHGQPGGAALLGRLVEEVATTLEPLGVSAEVSRIDLPAGMITPHAASAAHSYAVWSPHPLTRGDHEAVAWRVESHLGIDDVRVHADAPARVLDATNSSGVDLIVVDDAGLGFRDDRVRWPNALMSPQGPGQPPWTLLKMAAPVAQGELWHHLARHQAERLVVVMTLDDLRHSDVKISRELSWERTAGDIAAEVVRHPAVNALVHCAHVIVSVRSGGAVLLSRRGAVADQLDRLERPDCHVIFDPEAIEDSWAERHPGSMIGSTTCLTASIARELLLAPDRPDIRRGIRRGMAAARELHRRGYDGPDASSGRTGLTFPFAEIAQKMSTETGEFASARVSQPTSDTWSILQARYPAGLESVARSVARDGIDGVLDGVPLGRFGKLTTVDRGEIEGFRSIRELIREHDLESVSRPLSIAVFGPPGSGKSFGVRAVAKASLAPGRVEALAFNLSQMEGPEDLADALHQVRDASLRGHLPFVLWDEFDCELAGERYGWLRHFLAPMQDGTFQQGQVVHPIGGAIFVFAGGTSARLRDFAGNDDDAFRHAKGPDFVSRLKGHVDVVGPNPRGGDADADPHCRLRRAILLRAILLRDRPNLFTQDGGRRHLRIDGGVLRAFLEVGAYRHGARSLETIVSMSALHDARRYERSALPAAEQLDAHVDANDFLGHVERYVPEGCMLERLAEAVHVAYCTHMLEEGYAWGGSADYLAAHGLHATPAPDKGRHPSLVDFADLPAESMEQARGAARDLSRKVAALGYALCMDAPAGAPEVRIDVDSPRVEQLAREEHERWMRARLAAGWRRGPLRDDEDRVHPAIRPWSELSEAERQKDRQLIVEIPGIVAAAGMSLARVEEPAPPASDGVEARASAGRATT